MNSFPKRDKFCAYSCDGGSRERESLSALFEKNENVEALLLDSYFGLSSIDFPNDVSSTLIDLPSRRTSESAFFLGK